MGVLFAGGEPTPYPIPVLKPTYLCLYHKYCMDGFLAAWAVGNALGFKNVEFIALDYDDPVPDIAGRIVYMVDFSFKPHELLPVLETASKMIMIDHHKSAIEDWKDYTAVNFAFEYDMEQSGGILTWRHFNPGVLPPILFSIAQDYDLWLHKNPATRNVIAALYARGFINRQEWETASRLIDQGDEVLRELYEEGKIVQQANRSFLDVHLSRTAKQGRFAGFDNVVIANVPYAYASLAGDMLCRMYPDAPFSVTYDDWHSKGMRKFSMRGRKADCPDLSRIAKSLGGGGHESSAGFVLPLNRYMATYLPVD